MDQKILHAFESRCVQEEPPGCATGCPLHLDARALTGHVAAGQWDQAWQVLQKTMPFPALLARICDAPCRGQCRRADLDDAVQIGLLEKAVVAHPPPVAGRRLPMPSKNMDIVVVGGALSSLTVAWDLARKGYGVTIWEPDRWLGAAVCRAFSQLAPELIRAETAGLTSLGVRVQTGRGPDLAGQLGWLSESHGAVFLGLDAVDDYPWPLARDAHGSLSLTTEGQVPGGGNIFAGGKGMGVQGSPVRQAAEGRWAATSIDRFLQKVSMTAGREKEKTYPSRLKSIVPDIAPQPAVPEGCPPSGYTENQARLEAQRCLQCQCLECVKACEYMKHFKGYPKKYAREIYNNATVIMGRRQANTLINSCSLCGLCEQICPHDFSMADLCLEARQELVAGKKMPPSAHDFALRDLAFSRSERFALARHAPGATASSHLFFPGCQLCASSPGQAARVYDYLRGQLDGGVALMLGCCGAPAHWAGRLEQFAADLSRWKDTWTALGRPRPIMACATCRQIFTEHLPEAGATSLWEVLDDAGAPLPVPKRPSAALAIHDPCTTRDAPGVQQAVRRLLHRMGVSVEELDLGREKTECCGFGGLMQNANPDVARRVARQRARRSASDYLAYCAMCRDNLAAVGKPAWHLLDLIFPDETFDAPARRPKPGWSRRRENRSRLKTWLMANLWKEESAPMSAYTAIKLEISPQVEELLDRRRILMEDLQQVIQHAESGGDRLFHPPSGRYKAARALHGVTFWVEYTSVQDSYIVHNAYAHRMEVIGP